MLNEITPREQADVTSGRRDALYCALAKLQASAAKAEVYARYADKEQMNEFLSIILKNKHLVRMVEIQDYGKVLKITKRSEADLFPTVSILYTERDQD